MSSSGGFDKYRCSYFYQAPCQDWVYVKGATCVTCLVSFRVSQAVLATEKRQAMGRGLREAGDCCLPRLLHRSPCDRGPHRFPGNSRTNLVSPLSRSSKNLKILIIGTPFCSSSGRALSIHCSSGMA